MALPVVRTRDEAHLYMDLHPCERCGGVDVTWQSALTDDEGAPARRYHGTCARCQAPREFVFRLPERPALPGPDDLVFFGGAEPSQLLDAGEWRIIADAAIKDGSAPASGDPVIDADRKQSFAVGVAAFGEILKFIADSADATPASVFWTPHGRALYDKHPEQFTRQRLEQWHQNFQYEMEVRFYEP
jgi:hypothetical protein